MNVNIRHEQTQDFLQVEEVARDAFWNLYFPGANEHFVVHKMRTHKDFIQELSFVIEVDSKIAGAIFYTHSAVVLNDNTKLNTISFGPVFIAPNLHRMGLGRKLISHSINIAKEAGHKAIITLGYPHHYSSYGFVGAKKYNIAMPDGKYYTGLLALPLVAGALDNINGQPVFSDVFEVNPDDVDAYDQKHFAPKAKEELPCQKEFEIACSEIDENNY